MILLSKYLLYYSLGIMVFAFMFSIIKIVSNIYRSNKQLKADQKEINKEQRLNVPPVDHWFGRLLERDQVRFDIQFWYKYSVNTLCYTPLEKDSGEVVVPILNSGHGVVVAYYPSDLVSQKYAGWHLCDLIAEHLESEGYIKINKDQAEILRVYL